MAIMSRFGAARRVVLAALVLAIAIAAPVSGAMASPTPQYVRASWTDSQDTSTTMTITWNTSLASHSTLVQYGLTQAYGQEAEGVGTTAPGKLGAVHEVELKGLLPHTEYHYRVGGPGAWSGDYTFRTGVEPSGCTPFRFAAMGDGRSDDSFGPSPKWSPILTEAIDREPGFVILTGDQVKEGKVVDQWANWLEATYGNSTRVPIMPSLGNHDDDSVQGDGALYNLIFSLPKNASSGTEDFYYFTYGNAIFVALSMVTFDNDGFAQQAAWLDQVFTDNPKPWKFVYFHHPIYTGTLGIPGMLELNHPPNERGQNAALVPIFDKHGVDIVFMGHNHHYQRFKPMCCGGGGNMGVSTGSPSTGTTYVITGGAGALTYDASALGIDLPGLLCLTQNSAKCSGKHHYMVVEIDGLELKAEVWATSNQLVNASPANIELLDEFTISKPGPLPDCSALEEPVEEPVEPPADPDPPESDASTGSDATEGDTSAADANGGPADGISPADATTPGGDSGAGGPDTAHPPSDTGAEPNPRADAGPQGEGDAQVSSDTSGGPGVPPFTPGGGAQAPTGETGESDETKDSSDGGCRQTSGGHTAPASIILALLSAWAIRRHRRRRGSDS